MTLVYRGRGDVPATALSEWDVLPSDLLPRLAAAPAIVVLDIDSFPFESLRAIDWEIPMMVVVDDDPERAAAIHGDAVLRHLGPFDRIVTTRATFDALARDRWWADDMYAPVADPAALVEAASSLEGPAKRRWLRRIRSLAGALRRLGHARVVDIGEGARPWRCWLPRSIEWTASDPEVAVLVDQAHDGDSAADGWRAVGSDGWLVLLDRVEEGLTSPRRLLASVEEAAGFAVERVSVTAIADHEDRHRSVLASFRGTR